MASVLAAAPVAKIGGVRNAKVSRRASVVTAALRPRTAATAPFSRDLAEIFQQNKEWADAVNAEDPTFFEDCNKGQAPQLLWVGCADSRVVANQACGLLPGEVFVQRNVGNQFLNTDMNVMSALEYSVTALGVTHVVVCGHYNCGAVNAALTLPASNRMVTNNWISGIRDTRNKNADELLAIEDADDRLSRLCELNVMTQVFNVATSNVVQERWAQGKELHIHGVVYGLADGRINRLAGPISSNNDVYSKTSPFKEANDVIMATMDFGDN